MQKKAFLCWSDKQWKCQHCCKNYDQSVMVYTEDVLLEIIKLFLNIILV